MIKKKDAKRFKFSTKCSMEINRINKKSHFRGWQCSCSPVVSIGGT